MAKQKGTYVDGFVIVVPKNKLGEYKKMAIYGKKLWMKYGALDYKECVGDDMHPNMGGMKALTFPRMAKAKRNQVIVFSYILYKNRAHRDQVNKKVMNDPSMQDPKNQTMPFDMKGFAYGGFKVIVGS